MVNKHDPDTQIEKENSWYTDNQFRSQLGTLGRRKIIENRWNIFQVMIQDWLQERKCDDTGRGFKMLDAGCGDGINLIGISKKAKENKWNLELTGVDYNPIRVTRASEQGLSFRIQKSSLYSLPFETESFDVILCNHVLEHIPDLSIAMSDLYRVMKTGGLFIAGVPNEGCLMARLRNNVFQKSISQKTDHAHFFTKESFTQQLIKSGFVIRSIENETFFFPISYINMFLNEFTAGHVVMSLLRKMFPSQAGGIIVASMKICTKSYAYF